VVASSISWTRRSERVRVGILGRPAVYSEGRPVLLAGAREAGLLALLVANAGRLVRAEVLADELWEGRLVSDGALRVTVNRLRKRLTTLAGDDPVRSEPGGYRLELDAADVDAWVYEDLLRRSREQRERGDPQRSVRLIEQGEALWRGQPYDGFGQLPSLRADGDRLDELRWSALELRAAVMVELGALRDALVAVDELLVGQPFRESLWGLRMVVLARMGRRRDALVAFDELRELLELELGVTPGDEVRTLASAIRSEQPVDELRVASLETPARPRTVRGRPVTVTTPIGRDEVVARMSAALEGRDVAGVGIVVLTGEPGIGKTTVLEHFLRQAELGGATTLLGRCDRTGAVPLRAVVDAIQPYLGPAGGARGTQVVELLQRQRTGTVDDAQQLEVHRRHLLGLLVDLLAELAGGGPVVLGIDDAHWADPLSLALLDLLVREHPDLELLVVLAVRTTEPAASDLNGLLADLVRRVAVEEIEVPVLPATAMGDLLGDHVPIRLHHAIHRSSGGNPLYALQLQRLIGPDGMTDGALPADLGRLCGARLAALSPEALALLEGAAVLGDEWSATQLAQLVGTSRAAAAAALVELRRDGLLVPTDGFDQFRFVHGIIRQEVYEGIEPGRRAHLHHDAAALLETSGSATPGAIALHLAEARPLADDQRIAEAALRAGEHALRTGGYATAERFFRTVVGLTSPSDAQLAVANFGLGLGQAASGDLRGSATTFVEGYELARESGRWDLAADTLIARARMGLAASIPEATADAQRAADTVDRLDVDDRDRRARLLLWRTDLLVNVSPEEATASLDLAEQLLDDLDDEHLRSAVEYERLRLADSASAPPATCAARATALMQGALERGDVLVGSNAAVMLQAARMRGGQLQLACAEQEGFAALAAESGNPSALLNAAMTTVGLTLATEPLDVGDEVSMTVTTSTTPDAAMLGTVARLVHLMMVRREQGRLTEIEPLLVGSLMATPRRFARPFVAASRLGAGDLAGVREHLGIFRDELEQLQSDWAYLATLAVAAEVVAEMVAEDEGAGELVEPLRRRLASFEPQVVVACSVIVPLGHVDRPLGLLAAAAGELDEAVERLERAHALDGASGMPLWSAWAAHGAAAARLRRDRVDDRDAARRHLVAAAEAAERMRSSRLAGAAARTTARLGAPS